MEIVAHPVKSEVPKDANGDIEMDDPEALEESSSQLKLERTLLFRCFTCKRASHYAHLPLPKSFESDSHIADVAEYYQGKGFLCADCVSFRYPLDKILAWRPYPATAVETESPPNYRNPLPREYLVKWTDRSYRRLSWVPHMWLLSTNQSKLKNFLSGGAKVELLTEIPIDDEAMDTTQNFEIGASASKTSSDKGNDMTTYGPLDALPDAEKRIPPRWKTVDRVLDLIFWDDESKAPPKKSGTRKGKKARVIESDEDDAMDEDNSEPEELKDIFDTGELPENLPQLNASEWEQVHDEIKESDISKVVWAFVKWDDLGYEEGIALLPLFFFSNIDK
jgi:chromodomain-helicase-DNA-binding protein 4